MICLARFDFVLENPLKKTLKLENKSSLKKITFLEKWNRPSKCRQNLIFLSFFSILVHILGRNHFFQKKYFRFYEGHVNFCGCFYPKKQLFWKKQSFLRVLSICEGVLDFILWKPVFFDYFWRLVEIGSKHLTLHKYEDSLGGVRRNFHMREWQELAI